MLSPATTASETDGRSSAADEPSRPRLPGMTEVRGDDELDAALAAQRAMYTGPISVPLANADPVFRPDPAELHAEVPPPTLDGAPPPLPDAAPLLPPPPPPPPAPAYVAPDAIAADPEPLAGGGFPPATSSPALGDDELSRSVEDSVSSGSTLDAILLLENELRRRQGLPPVDDAAEPIVVRPPAEPELAEPGLPPTPPADIPPASEQAWIDAPPPSFEPPALVEPPPAPRLDGTDPSTLLPPPLAAEAVPEATISEIATPDAAVAPSVPEAAVPETALPETPHPMSGTILGPDGPVDVSLLPPPSVAAVPAVADDPAEFSAAPPDTGSNVQSVPAVVPASTATMVAVGEAPEAPATDPPAFHVERVAAGPTPAEHRAGHAARLFWLWFAANSSIVMVAVGAVVFSAGMSLRQALVAVVAGVALSALPLGLGSLAGKWSGQPTMIVSRATFGLVGNVLPALLAVLGRVLWGGVLLWLLAVTAGAVLVPGAVGTDAGVPALVVLVVGAALAAVVATFGYGLLHRVQRVLGLLSFVLVGATIALTASHVDIATALRTDDGPWTLAIGGAVTVFSVVGLAWAQSSSDLARYQRPGGSGAANMLWSSFGVIVPTLALLSWGAVLAASDAGLGAELARAPLATLVSLVPEGLALPLLGAAGFGLVSGTIVTMYSGGLALISVGLRVPRSAATIVAAVLVTLVAAALLLLGADTRDILRDVVTTLAVPVAAWVGIFASEMMIRLRRFHAPSLLASGGIYPAVRWINLLGLVVASAIGFGLTTGGLAGFDWQGYLFGVVGLAPTSPLATADIGVLVALALGFLLPIVTGIPAIRRQEREGAAADEDPASA